MLKYQLASLLQASFNRLIEFLTQDSTLLLHVINDERGNVEKPAAVTMRAGGRSLTGRVWRGGA